MNKKLINVVKGDINTALRNGNYNRNTTYQTNIEFNTPTKLILLDGIPYSSPLLTKVTWQELKDKRDAGELTPGTLYRITDYQCTTTQENTRSAGHQFDIVLLALSENKLAEEGWAMMNESNIYDVTFSDGVTLKCYLYKIDEDEDYIYTNIVRVDTLAGLDYVVDVDIDEDNKTAIASPESSELINENLTYNYFQNSNLSAWKVWYCLDNDKSRFAWADDNVDSVVVSINTVYLRDTNKDNDFDGYYGWTYPAHGNLNAVTLYTTTENPQAGDTIFDPGKISPVPSGEVVSVQTEGTGLPNGRGVIYRLIDEWNNDVPYDFKNIQFIRNLNGGQLDAKGTNTYCYTFTLYDVNSHEYKDASIFAINYKNDENGIRSCYDNKIETICAYDSISDFSNKYALVLPNIICIAEVETGEKCWNICKNIIKGYTLSVSGDSSFNNVYSKNSEYTDVTGAIIVSNKKAVFENI